MSKSIIEKYINQPLARDKYGINREYFADDFFNIDRLSHIIAETYSSEISFSKAGINFLKEYYGFDGLGKLIEKKGGIETGLRTANEIINWLETLEKDSV